VGTAGLRTNDTERLLTSHDKTITNEELHPYAFTEDKHITCVSLKYCLPSGHNAAFETNSTDHISHAFTCELEKYGQNHGTGDYKANYERFHDV
jgi:hypothetical protein